MNISTAADDAEILKEVRDCANKLASSLPKRIQAAALTRRSKLPFKTLSIRELLLHRTVALTNVTVDLFEGNNVIPAVILTRSIVETLAVLFAFYERLEHFLKDESKNIDALDEFLMRCLLGSRDNPELPTAINVITLIDQVEKTITGFRSVYNTLCEYTHPNWAGTLRSFGKIMREGIELELGPNERTPAYSTGLSALSGSLMAFEYYYKKSGELIHQLNEYFDKDTTKEAKRTSIKL